MAPDMNGRVCIITGASSGIGLETARSLAGFGARLGLVCRSEDRGNETVHRIRQETGNPQVVLHLADLRSQAQVRRAAGEILDRYEHVHVLLNNAGLIAPHRSVTEDGVETVVEGVSGRFFSNCRARKLPGKARNREKEQELWRRTEAMLAAA